MVMVNCRIHGLVRGHKNGKKAARCSLCNTKRNLDAHKDVKTQAVAHLGGKCINCGYDKCQNALEFHHVYPEHKEFSLRDKSSKTFKAILPELKKCVLLCANCHRELHAGLHTIHMGEVTVSCGTGVDGCI